MSSSIARLVRLPRFVPVALVVLVATASQGACGGSVQGGGADAAVDAKADPGDPVESCASAGGRCGPTPDLPCGADEQSIRGRCDEGAPCCVKLPPLGPGECRTGGDCESQSIPGKSAGSGTCEGGACVCGAGSTRLANGRCGPAPEAGESYLCTVGDAFPKGSAVCGVIPCDPGAVCARSGGTAQCMPPKRRVGEETCVLVNCGAIFCAEGLVCTDAARGVCKPE